MSCFIKHIIQMHRAESCAVAYACTAIAHILQSFHPKQNDSAKIPVDFEHSITAHNFTKTDISKLLPVILFATIKVNCQCNGIRQRPQTQNPAVLYGTLQCKNISQDIPAQKAL